MKTKFIYRWVIQSREKFPHWWGKRIKLPKYSLCRVSYKDPRHLRTGELYRARFFKTKQEAEKYFFKRVNHGGEMAGLSVRRRKLFIDQKYNCLAYSENNNR